MLEKINQKGYEAISKPCSEVLALIKEMKRVVGGGICVAEIGIGIGATANAIVKCLDASDNYYMFSYENAVLEVEADLKQTDYCIANLYAIGNTTKTYDSYCWTLAKLYLEKRHSFLDLTYLDGAHSFFHDGLACCLLKKMTKVGGIIVFDDINWSHATSPTANPKKNPDITKNYTQEQLTACQVAMVVDIFMKDDMNWELLEEYSSSHRVTYKRIL